MKRPIRILWNVWANALDFNAQSLTARELALRLPPERFASRFLHSHGAAVDPRLIEARAGGQAAIDWLTLPRRFGSQRILREFLWGDHDILFYPALNPRASRLYRHLRPLGRSVKVVNSIECSWPQMNAEPPAVLRQSLYWARHSDLCVAITPAISKSLQNAGIDTEVIPLGVDLERFRPPQKARQDPRALQRVIFVASMQRRKQPHLILELARRLKDHAVEFHLIGPVLGNPDYYHQLLNQKEAEGLGRVHFHGAMQQEEIRQWLESSDIYVLPSRLEGFGKTTIEAAACGLPAVIFSDYESTAVVDGRTGFQVETFDDMVEKVRLLLDEPGLRQRLGEAALSHVRQFDWDVIARRWQLRFERLYS